MTLTNTQTRPYKKKSSEYIPADKFFIVNDDDPDLIPIKIHLPKPPKLQLIDGYGLSAKDQYFTRVKVPSRLLALEERALKNVQARFLESKGDRVTGQKILDEIWKLLEGSKYEYRSEIEWMQKQIYYILNGYWCFINGKPTYIDGWHYGYCNFWNMEDVHENDGYPEYRDRDRRWFHFARYCYTTTEDENGNDIGFRTSFGFMYPKHRRDGATHKSLCVGYFITIFLHGALFGIQSFDDDNASEHYRTKVVPAWKSMPFFLRPMWSGSNNPQTELSFRLPTGRAYGQELGSKINYATTSHRKFYDGKKLYYLQDEEEGKCLLENIRERWNVQKHCLAQGDAAFIHGFSTHPSTVADMIDQGGMNYYYLSEDSVFNERDEVTKQTASGLFRLFIPAWDGLEGYIGPYGESIIDDPTPEQAKFINRKHGAKRHILGRREYLLRKNTPEARKQYREHVMLFPTEYAECFRVTSGNIGFNEEIIDDRIKELRRKSKTVIGDLKREDGTKDGRVEFCLNPNGRWKFSKQLSREESNLRRQERWFNPIDNEWKIVWTPSFPTKRTAGADPFEFSTKTEAKLRADKDRMSDGGGSVLEERNPILDPGDIRSEWKSYGLVATYRYRPANDDDYAEDMLMACVYWGAMMFSENNIGLVNKHFIKRGYAGYLKYAIDEVTGRKKETPGYFVGGASKIEMFSLLRDYIEFHGHKENHLDFLLEAKAIKGMEFLTNYDILAAVGAALMGSKSSYAKILERIQQPLTDLSLTFPQRYY